MSACLASVVFRVGRVCLATGMILFAGQSARVWGQLSEPTESVQQAETINPQYEYNVKAAFLYSFGRYVEWPKDAFSGREGAFVIGVCGEYPFGQSLDRIAQTKTIQGRRIIVQRMAAADELQPCQILFVSRSVPVDQQTVIINKIRNDDKSTLLVGESPGFAERGGGINFYVENGMVRFEINIDAIRQEKVLLDAKLMNLGKKIPYIGTNK